jgi:1,2-diacylglycerol 3-alpha-glucosyltransferase
MLVVNVTTDHDVRECQRLLQELALESHVDLVPHRSFAEIPLFLAAADVTVVSRPQCPGVPIKLLNYMAAGKPIVVFEGSAKGLQHLHHALVVPDHDWQALGYGMLTLIQDPACAARLGQNARRWADEQFSWKTIVGRIEQVYYELVEPGTRTTSPPSIATSSPTRPRERV